MGEGICKVIDVATRNCYPIYGRSQVKRMVHVRQETVSKADIQALVWPGAVYQHVHAALVFWGEVNLPDLSS